MSALQPIEVRSILDKALPGKVLHHGEEAYDKSNNTYFSVFENDIKPAFIAQPTNAAEVSALIRLLHPHLSRRELAIAVRGTGHTPFKGSANIQDGVTLDLRGLKGISLNQDKSLVTFGVGETWSTIYTELEQHGLTTAGGRVGRVGVGGLLLGGGLSFYSSRVGFACDSITDFEVVLASGEVVHANAQENSDLWVSLKGGLNNFGIVTSIQTKTFETGTFWGGVNYYLPTDAQKMWQTTCDFVNHETDLDTHVMTCIGYGRGHEALVSLLYHTGGIENAPAVQKFIDIPGRIDSYSNMHKGSQVQFCEEMSKFTEGFGLRTFYASITIRPDVTLMDALQNAWQQATAPLRSIEGAAFSITYLPLSKNLLQASKDAGGNAKNIDPEDGPLLIVLYNQTWAASQDDEKVHQTIEDLLAECKRLAKEKNLLHRYIFTNYAHEKDDPIRGYGEESLARLKAASQKFDPEGIFQDTVPGGFKIPKN